MTTLMPPKLVENKFSRTSRLSRLVLHKKFCRVGGSKVKIHCEIPKLFQFVGRKSISVSSPPLMQNRPWRINNYSTRYLLYESLVFSHSFGAAKVHLGGEMRQHLRFADFGVHWSQEMSLLSKISSFSKFPPHGPKPWALQNF